MSQFPPSGEPTYGTTSYPSAPYPSAPEPKRSIWPLLAALGGLLITMPCLCCGGCLAYSMTVKEITLTNGQHLGGPPMNIEFDYAFNGQDHGPLKSYYIVVKAANGSTREQSVGGFGFGIQRIPLRGRWRFANGLDLGPEGNKKPVQVWIEASAHGNDRYTASNTLTIYPKQ
jgi:hypothetical protein